ncbi:transcriptional regulator [Bowdeniella nasicola]|uniref:Transcriptional regulator n=1 Tax=Bowdeniella nasicola TaxID=208480 RepID=A0A1Q5PZC9_9ACTO|nr:MULTISPECIES: metalloregulator ArsR/SmtB family transcription factor [Bowdeniella]OKL52974.1 transcriptional regulator [Bowdeniella nasicola]
MEELPLTAGHPVVALFSALANPIRASIVHRLTSAPASVNELVEWLSVTQPLVSHHLKILRDAHLVEASKEGRRSVYSLVDDHVAHIYLDALTHMKEHNHDCDH